jgi:structural maintenance of chromosome 2
MAYVFGSTLICRDPTVAKLVTFDKRVNVRSVTYDGDIYDPSGQLSGGAKSQSSGLLMTMTKIKNLKIERDFIFRELGCVNGELNELLGRGRLYHARLQEKDLKEHELKLIQNRMANNPLTRLIAHVDSLIEDHKQTKIDLEAARLKLGAAEEKVRSISAEMEELCNNRESKVASLKKQIKETKKDLEKLEPSVGKLQEGLLMGKEEISQCQSEIHRIQLSLESHRSDFKEAEREEDELTLKLKTEQVKYDFISRRNNSIWSTIV